MGILISPLQKLLLQLRGPLEPPTVSVAVAVATVNQLFHYLPAGEETLLDLWKKGPSTSTIIVATATVTVGAAAATMVTLMNRQDAKSEAVAREEDNSRDEEWHIEEKEERREDLALAAKVRLEDFSRDETWRLEDINEHRQERREDKEERLEDKNEHRQERLEDKNEHRQERLEDKNERRQERLYNEIRDEIAFCNSEIKFFCSEIASVEDSIYNIEDIIMKLDDDDEPNAKRKKESYEQRKSKLHRKLEGFQENLDEQKVQLEQWKKAPEHQE